MKIPFTGSMPKPEAADDRMSLTQHLAELRIRIIRSLLAIVAGVIILLATYDQVLNFLWRPYRQLCVDKPELVGECSLQFLGPLEGFTTRLTICTYGGIILALPVILWQVWRFIVPALHANEKKYAIPFVTSSVLLFVLGGLVAWFTLTPALDFLISWSGEGVEANFQVSKYINLVGADDRRLRRDVRVPGAAGVPAARRCAHAADAHQAVAHRHRRHLRLAAVITPSGDPYSMLALAIPMVIFYGISIVIGKIAQKRKLAREAAEDAA